MLHAMRPIALLSFVVLAVGCGSAGQTTTGGGAATTSESTTSTTSEGGAGGGGTTSSTTTSSATGGSAPLPAPKGCVTDVSAGHHVFPCDSDIAYDVEVPPACAAGGCGLVLDMHGYTMNAASEDAGTGMRALGQQHGYVVVQPTAPFVSGWVQATHVGAVYAFVKDVAEALVTDPKRAHAMGFSQGGGMTWRMICAHADFFASAAPISGVLGCEFTPPNVPSREVPTLQVHGHKDAVLNFQAYAIPERDAAIAFWKLGAGTVIESDSGHTATRYESPFGTPFEFWEHDYAAPNLLFGGHCFPGGSDVGPGLTQFGCAEQGTFDVGELAMEFFLAHPMP
jgi:polyhydroxybutyrate depolymerase